MKICAMSDLHGFLPKKEDIPNCNVVIIAGDISPLNLQKDFLNCSIWFGYTFIPWCESLPCEKVIIVAGNHDFFFQLNERKNYFYKYGNTKKVIYLQHATYKYNHKTFFGTPYVEDLPRWAFNLSDEAAKKYFSEIPNCDVLISHTPPFNAACTGRIFSTGSIDYGSYNLRDAIINKNIALILCGHVHSGNHELTEWENHLIANVSILNEDYQAEFSPLLIEI